MSSLFRLNSFLKDQGHDIVDYWIHDNSLRYVRVLSVKSGQIYMINLKKYNIRSGDEDSYQELQRTCHYYLEDDSEYPKELEKINSYFQQLYKKKISDLVFQFSNFLFENHHTFRVRNQPSSKYYQVFFMIDIEWFYENTQTISHEIERIWDDYIHPLDTLYQRLTSICTVTFPISTDKMKWIHHGHDELSKKRQKWREACVFYSTLSERHLQIRKKLLDLQTGIISHHYNFNDTIKRSHQKQKLQKYMEEIIGLKKQLMDKLICLQKSYFHTFCLYTNACMQLLTLLVQIQTFLYECENEFRTM